MRQTCPVCDAGMVPVEMDTYPYSTELECPYCRGNGFLDPEDPDAARALRELQDVDSHDPEFLEHVVRLAQRRAARLAADAAADLALERMADRTTEKPAAH